MAWMSQEKKAKIAAKLKDVVPKGWKYTLAVRNRSEIVMTISEAPVDLLRACKDFKEGNTSWAVNEYWVDRSFTPEVAEILSRIFDALNLDNHDNSDIQTDYFDVGHYVALLIGRWDKPFKCSAV